MILEVFSSLNDSKISVIILLTSKIMGRKRLSILQRQCNSLSEINVIIVLKENALNSLRNCVYSTSFGNWPSSGIIQWETMGMRQTLRKLSAFLLLVISRNCAFIGLGQERCGLAD